MSDEQADGSTTVEATPVTREKNPVRGTALIVLLVACLLFALSVFLERRTPISSQATVQAYVVGIAPEVAGKVVEVGVADNSRVVPDQMLFRIDPAEYQLRVAEAEARLAQVGQSIGASTASIEALQARVVDAKTARDHALEQASRAAELVKKGVYSQVKYDDAKTALDRAEAALVAAEADLKRGQEELGPAGADNPQLREALAALERARLDLASTTVTAPADGVVTNLQLTTGEVVGVGQSAMTFIDINTIWITAAFKENSLENVAPGNRAQILFDALPGQLFEAKVESVGLGVAQGTVDPSTGLPKVSTDSGWVRTPQSFPVRLVLEEQLPKGVRYGSQADVVIYTGDNPGTNAVGSLLIRALSWLTYVS